MSLGRVLHPSASQSVLMWILSKSFSMVLVYYMQGVLLCRGTLKNTTPLQSPHCNGLALGERQLQGASLRKQKVFGSYT